jgi:signal transduction histidine kinase
MPTMLKRFRRLSLDLKLIGSYLVILGVGGIAISVVGSWIVATTMQREAERTVSHDVTVATAAWAAPLRAALGDGGDPQVLAEDIGTSLATREAGDGVVALFRADRCVASAPAGRIGAGTRAPRGIAALLLAAPPGGETTAWQPRAGIAGVPYIGAWRAVRAADGRPLGLLYVGRREASYTAARNFVISSFFLIATVGFGLVIAVTYRIIHNLTRPIRNMVAATRSVAAGRFDHPVAVGSEGEIGLLAQSLNAMQTSLQQMRRELEEAARTLEDKVAARTDELARMQLRMAQSERLASIGVLAAGVAHEINNPLGGILALTALALEQTAADDPRRENLEEVVRQTRRCGEIVKHLLEFSRQNRVIPEEVDLNALVGKTLALLERQAMFLNVRVERDLQGDLPRLVADGSQLQQVLINILMNAVQAMHEHGTLRVQSRYDRGRDDVVLAIRDSGCGIPAEQIDRIFDPFYTTKESGQGTGLGLSIAYGIVSRHHGAIEVESAVGAGTTFTIRLPARPRTETPSEAETLAAAGIGA